MVCYAYKFMGNNVLHWPLEEIGLGALSNNPQPYLSCFRSTTLSLDNTTSLAYDMLLRVNPSFSFIFLENLNYEMEIGLDEIVSGGRFR